MVGLLTVTRCQAARAGLSRSPSAARGVATSPAPLACFGEIGLTGELRSVAHPECRSAEAEKFGLRQVLSPATAPTLRAAVRAALGDRDRPVRAA